MRLGAMAGASLVVVLACVPAAVAAQTPPAAAGRQVRLPAAFTARACPPPLAALGAICGTFPVAEDRSRAGGRRIGLNVVLLPARADGRTPAAVTYLAGGPGSAATDMAPFVARQGAVRAAHDVLLVDQRGTGGSHPLNCVLYDEASPASLLGDFFPPQSIRRCRAELEQAADLTLYTTAVAADDLDEVRRAFGYRSLTLVGISYGTRAALVYMRRHPGSVRAAVLEGVAPPDDFIPRAFAEVAQRALEGVLADCRADVVCNTAFPGAGDDAKALFQRLAAAPAPVRAIDPATGEVVQVFLGRDVAAEAVRYMLYSAGGASVLPAALHYAARGDLGPLAEFALSSRRNVVASGANGMYLSVTCAEDLPWIGDGERAPAGAFLGDYRLEQQRAACALWPRGAVPADFAEPVRSDAPVLLISGQWDPVTPPAAAERAARTLPNSRHIVVPQGGHGTAGLVNGACVDAIRSAFIVAGDGRGLDTACLDEVRRVPFLTAHPAPPPVVMSRAELERFAGSFAGLGVPLAARVEALEGRLRLRIDGGPDVVLVPTGARSFRVAGILGSAATFEAVAGAPLRLFLMERGEVVLVLERR
jgi:pimeloyl-ACP methyl ester carboxylesterase